MMSLVSKRLVFGLIVTLLKISSLLATETETITLPNVEERCQRGPGGALERAFNPLMENVSSFLKVFFF